VSPKPRFVVGGSSNKGMTSPFRMTVKNKFTNVESEKEGKDKSLKTTPIKKRE